MNKPVQHTLAKGIILSTVFLLVMALSWKSLPPSTAELSYYRRLAFLVSPPQSTDKSLSTGASEPKGELLYIGDLASNQVHFLVETNAYGSNLHWSPDGKRLIVSGSFPTGLYALVVDPVSGENKEIEGGRYAWGSFQGWTADGHYAIFTSGDQYGNSDTTVFDAWQWRAVITTTATEGTCFQLHSMGGGCYRRVSTISPVSSTLVLQDGTLIDIPRLKQTSVISQGVVTAAIWTPDGQYLVFVLNRSYPGSSSRGCWLYLANGDGAQLRLMSEVPCLHSLLEWKDHYAVLWTESERFFLDPEQELVSIIPLASWEKPQLNQEESCGNLYQLLKQSPTTEITSACRSPDKTLLAIGKPGRLQIFDSSLNLLQTFTISGTVKHMAWAPTP
jgi:hypothetical protein